MGGGLSRNFSWQNFESCEEVHRKRFILMMWIVWRGRIQNAAEKIHKTFIKYASSSTRMLGFIDGPPEILSMQHQDVYGFSLRGHSCTAWFVYGGKGFEVTGQIHGSKFLSHFGSSHFGSSHFG